MKDKLHNHQFLVLFFIMLSLLEAKSQKECLADQRFILVQLRHDILKAHHETLNNDTLPLHYSYFPANSSLKVQSWNWSGDKNCCFWEGVTCNNDGRIVELDLNNSMVTGGISPMFRLRHLQRLNLAGNYFRGASIASDFRNLENLTHLNLSMSGFSGQIPIEISHLRRLVSLDLSSQDYSVPYVEGSQIINPLTLEKPGLDEFIQNFTTLKELNLEGVNLSTHNDANWGALPHLEALNLASSGLSGPIHPSLSHLHSLSHLNLRDNDLSASTVPKFLANFSHLTTVDLSYCNLRGEFPIDVFLLPKLQSIHIFGNGDLMVKLPEFSSNSSLKILSLGITNMSSGRLPNSISNLKLLENLDMPQCSLHGLIPSSFQNLTSLVGLYLSANSLTGSVPLSLFTLPSLQHLQVFDNLLSGQLDEFLSENASFSSPLEVVLLDRNNLTGSIPLSFYKLRALKHLFLSNNKFSGIIRLNVFLRSLKNLVSFHLSNNNLTIVETNDNNFTVSHLTELALGSCNLTEFPKFLQNTNVQLEYLDLSRSQLRGYVPSWIWNITTLHDLDLSYNSIDFVRPSSEDGGEGTYTPIMNNSENQSSPTLGNLYLQSCNLSYFPSFLEWQDKFEIIDLSDNKIHGQVPSWMWKDSLSYLYLSRNSLRSLGKFSPAVASLHLLDLHSNKLQGSFPFELVCNANSSLWFLDLSNNHFSGLIPECLGMIKTLEVLNLKGNNFHGMVHAIFSVSMDSLRVLNLNGNQLHGKPPTSLTNCTELEVLDLGNNNISGTFPNWLGRLPALKVLVLRNNSLKGPIDLFPTNGSFPVLHVLDLSFNEFTGSLSANFFRSLKGMLNIANEDSHGVRYIGYDSSYSVTVTEKGMEMEMVRVEISFASLDLSNNRFHGTIPEEIGCLKSLHALNASRNNFAGGIPSSIGNLTQLESLDLSHNQLSGRIPSQLTSLSGLGALDLSHNQLEGPIPQGNHLDTFPKAYDGNPKLCGLPLSRKCEEEAMPTAAAAAAKDESSEISTGFEWEYAWIGYGSGVVIGVSIGYIILS